jgi:hypothetical protein
VTVKLLDAGALSKGISQGMRSSVHGGHHGHVLVEEVLDGVDELIRVELHRAQFVDDCHSIGPARPFDRRQGNALEGGDVHPVAANPRALDESHMRHDR